MMKAKKPRIQKTPQSDDVLVGSIAGPFGIHGELKCDPTNAGRTLFSAGRSFRATLADGIAQLVSIEAARPHKGRLLVRFSGVDSVEKAEELRGATLHASRNLIELQPNEFLDADLLGCTLFDASGSLGTVERVEHYPASDMLVVRGKLVPLIEQFIKAIDIENKRIDVELPAGLLED